MQHGRRVLKILEVREHIVGKNSVQHRGVRRGIHFPRHASRLELFRHRRVRQPAIECAAVRDHRLQHRTAVFAVWVERSGHGVQPVRVGRAHHRAEIVVADRKTVRQRVVVRYVRPCVVAHRQDSVIRIHRHPRRHKSIHRAVVPTLVLGYPIVRDVMGTRCVYCRVQVKRQQRTDRRVGGVRWIRLLKRHALIGKSANTTIAAEIVVKRSILLNQNHDVFNVRQFRTSRRSRWNRWRTGRTPAAAMQRQSC